MASRRPAIYPGCGGWFTSLRCEMATVCRTSGSGRASRIALVAGVILAVPSFGATEAALAQEPVRLQILGDPGDWLEYTHRKEMRVELPPDLGGTATTVTSIRLRQEVDSVSADAVHYGSTLADVTFDVRPQPSDLPDLTGLQGLRFEHSTARTGRTVALKLPGTFGEAGPGLLEQVENWLSQLGFPPLPQDPVRAGDTWSESIPIPAAALGLALEYDLVQERETRLAEIREVGLNRVAVLEVQTTWIPAPLPFEAPRDVASLSGRAEQTVRFDIRRGRFLGSTGTSSLELVLAPAGTAQYVAVSAAGRQVTGLTGSGPR